MSSEMRLLPFSAEEVYRNLFKLIEGLQEKREIFKVVEVESGEPSYIRVRSRNGLLEVFIMPQDTKSSVRFSFDFSEYFKYMNLVAVLISFLGVLGAIYFQSTDPSSLPIGLWICSAFDLLFIPLYARERAKSIKKEFMNRVDSFLGKMELGVDQEKDR